MHDYFDEAVAARYDETSAEMFDPAVVGPVVDFLEARAGAGRALEFGIGTGRIALPLGAHGVEVYGIDFSAAMIDRLRSKPGASGIGVTIGDCATASAPGPFSLVYLLWNGIMNLTTQALQVACFRNAARHLASGGSFVIEVMLPDVQRLPAGERFRPYRVAEDRLGFDEYDIATQRMWSHHVRFEDDHARRMTVPFRYVWPAELDLMAELAGLRPVGRWSGWQGEPFTSDSRELVAVWEQP